MLPRSSLLRRHGCTFLLGNSGSSFSFTNSITTSSISRSISTSATATTTSHSVRHLTSSSSPFGSSLGHLFFFSTRHQFTSHTSATIAAVSRFHNLATPSTATVTKTSTTNSHSLSVRALRRIKYNRILLSRATAQQFSSSLSPSSENASTTTTTATLPTSLQPGTWLDKMPKSIQPYLYLTRIDKPIGTWLLLWPCIWSISMASYGADLAVEPTAYMIGLFTAGAVIMRGAGCTINDLWDKDIDNKVERTKIRPLASGAVSPKQAVAFLGLQLSAGLAILCQLNMYSILLGASSLSLVISYPAMKRITYWPQVVLGMAFNWGALLGSSAMLGTTNWQVALPLYASGICWTLVYDTIYAHQDKTDDIKVGVKSTALRFGENTPIYLTAFSTGMVSMLALSGYMNDQGPLFYALSVGGAAAHLAWQLRTVHYDNPADCWSKFASNKWTGALVFSGIGLDYLFR